MTKKIVAVLLACSIIVYWQVLSAVQWRDSAPVLFEIQGGETTEAVSKNLENQGLIRSAFFFKLFAKIRGIDTQLKSGRYQLRRNMNMQVLLHEFAYPANAEISLTIPEGFSVYDIDERLVEFGLGVPGEFVSASSNLEGYLFPDTYFVSTAGENPQTLISKMRDNFLKKLTPDLLAAIQEKARSLPEVITISSMLEKEVKTERDAPIVAGILWKRLDHDWPLQVDATLLYGKETTVITSKELNEDSAFNTRKYKGLPPTPIGNPGIAMIRAAIFPENSPYWFYLTDKEGAVHYAATNEEQNQNRKKYLGL